MNGAREDHGRASPFPRHECLGYGKQGLFVGIADAPDGGKNNSLPSSPAVLPSAGAEQVVAESDRRCGLRPWDHGNSPDS